MTYSLAFLPVGPFEIAIICALGVLIFGKRLPDVGRNIGKGIVEFKKGLKGVKDEIDDAVAESEDEDTQHIEASTTEDESPQIDATVQAEKVTESNQKQA